MGSCNATERRPHAGVSSGYKPYTPDQGSREGITPIRPLGRRSDGATENRPPHEGAILGITRYEVQYRRYHTFCGSPDLDPCYDNLSIHILLRTHTVVLHELPL